MSEWKEYRLNEIGTVVGGATPSTMHPEYYDGSIPWITPKDLTNWKDVYISKGERSITEAGYKSASCKIMPRGSVLFSSRAPIGYIAIAANDICTNQGFKSVVPNPDLVESVFLYYSLLYNRERIKALGSGTTFAEISGKVMSNVCIRIPSLQEQRAIASILSSLDAKIENNRKICANLEAQAQALFKHWFIDFAPFKDGKFVESELGMIPEGLIYRRIEDMPHTLETGKRPAGGVKGIDNGVPSIGAENIKGLGCYDYSKTKYVTKEYFDSMKKGVINGYELLIYKDGGKPGYFIPNFAIFGEGYPYKEMCLNEHVFKLDFGNKGYSLFAYFFFKTKQIMSYLNAQGAKAAIPGINSKDIEVVMMPSLDNEFVQNYCNEVEGILTHILVLSKESYRLSSLRDTLLPKLMSGEIKV